VYGTVKAVTPENETGGFRAERLGLRGYSNYRGRRKGLKTMKMTLRTELPEGYRDHGVFDVAGLEGPTPTAEDPQARAARLATAKADADARLTALFDKVKAGTASASEFAGLATLADDVSALDRELKEAQSAAATAEQRRAERAGEELRIRLEAALTEAETRKKEFADTYKATCLALGSYCAAIDEAIKLSSSWAQVSNLDLLDPRRTVYGNRIALLNVNLDPRPALTQAGLRGTVQHGWNCSFPIVPLHETRKEKL
jgi:hypothetical protein